MSCNVQPMNSINYYIGFHVIKNMLDEKIDIGFDFNNLIYTFYKNSRRESK